MIYSWGVIGHNKTLALLEDDLGSGQISSSYLFTGPNQLGKFTVACKFAGILQCSNNFCHQCNVCLQIEKGAHIDTIFAANDRESIKIEFVRDLISRITMTTQSKYTVVVIEAIERMTPEAANAMLKVLEEPPPDVVFVLTTENVKAILPTILSRVRVVSFGICPEDELKKELHQRFPELETEFIEQASALSLGKPGKALAFLEDRQKLDYYQALYNDICTLLDEQSIAQKFKYVDGLFEKEFKIEDFLDIFEHVLRTKLLNGCLNKDVTSIQSTTNTVDLIEKLQEARSYLSKNINSRLLLENLVLSV